MFTRISVVQAWLIEREPSRTMILDSTDANTLRSAYEDLRRNPACECNELESLQSAHARERSELQKKRVSQMRFESKQSCVERCSRW